MLCPGILPSPVPRMEMWLKFYDQEPGRIVRATATSISALGRKLELPTAVLSGPIFSFSSLLFSS